MATYFDIFNEPYNPFSTLEESTDYLLKACDRYDVLNLSYWFLGKSLQFPDRMTWLSTYSPDYMSVYLREFSPHGDPVFSICFDRLLPLDWAGLRMTDATAKIIHHTAEQYGVGHQGISFPRRCRRKLPRFSPGSLAPPERHERQGEYLCPQFRR